jgi:hypothetical protein
LAAGGGGITANFVQVLRTGVVWAVYTGTATARKLVQSASEQLLAQPRILVLNVAQVYVVGVEHVMPGTHALEITLAATCAARRALHVAAHEGTAAPE